jgi:hypothetical protein
MKPEDIDPNEWDFSRCPENEVNFCFVYEYSRQAALEGFGPLYASVARMRHEFETKDKKTFDDLAPAALTLGVDGLDIHEPGPGIYRLVFPFPEWPQNPYLSIPQEERARRLKILFPEQYETETGTPPLA